MNARATPLSEKPPIEGLRLIIFDVDGVLTDGTIVLDNHGVETKRFYVRDGTAFRAAEKLGLRVGVLTGRMSMATTHRMRELGVELFIQGAADKAIGFETLTQRAGVEFEETAYLGDDIVDLPAMMRCGYPMAVADAAREVHRIARYITHAPGGRGAAREAIEHILKAQQKWDAVLEAYGL